MLKTIAALFFAASLAGCAATSPIRPFPPEAANATMLNGAFLVMHGPYADDCWMYGWCAPPGALPNIPQAHQGARACHHHTVHHVATRCARI